MTVERIVQVHIAVLTTMGAVLLSMGHDSSPLPVLVVFAAATSVVFTDTLNWFRLNRFAANSAQVVALVATVSDFLHANARSQLIAIASLLVYLQITLLYQRKTNRIYWHLIVLSLLQVVVSAALSVGVEFGVLLVCYAGAAISTLCFFFVHREIARVTGSRPENAGGRGGGAQQPGPAPAPWMQIMDQRILAYPMASTEGLGRQVVGWKLLYQIVVIGATTLVFSVVLFFSTPRLNSTAYANRPNSVRRLVGFSPEITLDELTEILQNHELIMRVSFRDYLKNEPYRVFGDLYLRGSVLYEYVDDDGVATWRQRGSPRRGSARPPANGPRRPIAMSDWLDTMLDGLSDAKERVTATLRQVGRRRYRVRPPDPPPNRTLIRQDISLLPTDRAVLFGVFPVYCIESTDRLLRQNPHTHQLFRQATRRVGPRREYRYSLATTAFRGGLQSDITPHPNPLQSPADLVALSEEMGELLHNFDASRFPGLKRIADEIAGRLRKSNTKRSELARALRDHFHAAGRYTYTLNPTEIPRNPNVDPIEDFVVNHRMGHCEYFASALAMMLRSQGIPSRVVVGYKGSNYNAVGGYHEILQSDAHAWVDAYLDPDEVASAMPFEVDVGPAGGWLRLDPFPVADEDSAAKYRRGVFDAIDDVLDYARLLWADYVLELTARRQRESIYGPVSAQADVAAWRAFLGVLAKEREATFEWLQEFWTSWRVLLALAVVSVSITVLYVRANVGRPNPPKVVRAVNRLTARLTRQVFGKPQFAAPTEVVFYWRFERIMAEQGIARARGQTQREFAAMAAEQLLAVGRLGQTADLARRIVSAFYQVRFGDVPLSPQEAEAVNQALLQLEETDGRKE